MDVHVLVLLFFISRILFQFQFMIVFFAIYKIKLKTLTSLDEDSGKLPNKNKYFKQKKGWI